MRVHAAVAGGVAGGAAARVRLRACAPLTEMPWSPGPLRSAGAPPPLGGEASLSSPWSRDRWCLFSFFFFFLPPPISRSHLLSLTPGTAASADGGGAACRSARSGGGGGRSLGRSGRSACRNASASSRLRFSRRACCFSSSLIAMPCSALRRAKISSMRCARAASASLVFRCKRTPHARTRRAREHVSARRGRARGLGHECTRQRRTESVP